MKNNSINYNSINYIPEPKWKVGKHKIEKIESTSTDFPERLRNIPNPPKQIYCAGDIYSLKRKSSCNSRIQTPYDVRKECSSYDRQKSRRARNYSNIRTCPRC